MREDDDAPENGPAQGSLADGLGDTAGDEHSSSGDSYGDAYGDDGFDDTDDGTYGDGDVDDDPVDEVDTGSDTGVDADASVPPDEGSDDVDVALEDPLAEDVSPLEGVGFLIDELRDALFGEDDEGAASVFEPDPADLASDTDLDLTGDGVVDTADLHEAESPFDFGVDAPHHGHDGGVIDA